MDEVTDDTFQREVLEAQCPVVVDFCTVWCRPCRAVATILEELAVEHGDRVRFVKMNTDDNPLTVNRYGVCSVPTAILFERGEPGEAVIGIRARSYFEKSWARWLFGS